MRRFDEAIVENERALELDPLNVHANNRLGEVFLMEGQYDKALVQWDKSLDIEANDSEALYFISYGYELKRQYDQALDFWNKGLISEGHANIAEQNKRAYAVSGWPGVLSKKIERGSNSADPAYYDPYGVAETYAKLGDKEKAFEWLERAYSEQVPMAFLQVDPDLAPLRSDQRYAELVRRIGFPDGRAF